MRKQRLLKSSKTIEHAGGKAKGIVADLTKDEDSKRIVLETAKHFNGLDFVWNHVGVPGPASVEGIDMNDFDLALDLNLRTVLVTTDAALTELRARGGGSLLYTASRAGITGSPFSPVYPMAKLHSLAQNQIRSQKFQLC